MKCDLFNRKALSLVWFDTYILCSKFLPSKHGIGSKRNVEVKEQHAKSRKPDQKHGQGRKNVLYKSST